jgi:hypothetical protein
MSPASAASAAQVSFRADVVPPARGMMALCTRSPAAFVSQDIMDMMIQ